MEFAAVNTSTTIPAASQTAADQAAQRMAFDCEKDTTPGRIRCPGSRNVAAISRPMVADAAASWTTLAMGRPRVTIMPGSDNSVPVSNAPVRWRARSATRTASGSETAMTTSGPRIRTRSGDGGGGPLRSRSFEGMVVSATGVAPSLRVSSALEPRSTAHPAPLRVPQGTAEPSGRNGGTPPARRQRIETSGQWSSSSGQLTRAAGPSGRRLLA